MRATFAFVLLLDKLAETGVHRKWAKLISSVLPAKANTSSGHTAAADGYAYRPSGFDGPKGA